MIEDLRFVEREIREMNSVKVAYIAKILQAYDGHIWFDVPLVSGIEEPTQSVDKE